MAIPVTCDQCGQQFQAPDEYAGQRGRCPECGRELIVPKPTSPFAADELVFEREPVETRTSGKAVASLVLGILSFFCLSVLTGIPAIIFGALGLSDIRHSRGWLKGEGLAIAGIVTGSIGSLMICLSIALLLPAVQAAREAARRTQCVNNLKRISLALYNYHDTYGQLPPPAITDEEGLPLLSWRVAILPFLGEAALYEQFHLDEPWDSPHNRALIEQMPTVFACPSEPFDEPGLTIYQVLVGPGTLFEGPEGTRFQEVRGGLMSRLTVAESHYEVPWTMPEELDYDPDDVLPDFGSMHPGGFNALLGDGSVRFIRNDTPEGTLRALIDGSAEAPMLFE